MKVLSPRVEERGNLLVLYDGECVLCNSSVDFLLRRDREDLFLFAPLQGDAADGVFSRHEELEETEKLDGIVYVRGYKTGNERLYRKSTAVLKALDDLGGIWRVLSWTRIVPRVLRDLVYDVIAHNRYNWFGKYDECRIPDSADRDRFLN